MLLGAILCMFYDLFRLLRLEHRFSTLAVFLQDLFFWAVCAVVTFCFLLTQSNGKIRSYILLGMVAGFALCRLTLSVLFLKMFRPVVRFIIRCRRKAFDLLHRFYAFLNDVGEKWRKAIKNSLKILEKLRKKA